MDRILAKCTFGVLDNLRARLGRDSTYSERQEVHARITAQSAGLQAALRAVKDGGDAPGVEKGVLAPHGGVLTIFHSKDSARAVVPFEKFVWADRENEAAMREHPLAAAILELREELGPTAESSCVELARGFYSKMIQDGNGMILWGRGYRFEIFDEAGNDAFIFEHGVSGRTVAADGRPAAGGGDIRENGRRRRGVGSGREGYLNYRVCT